MSDTTPWNAKSKTDKAFCQGCELTGHATDECRTICSNCDEPGHWWKKCKKPCMKKCAYCGGGRHSEDICLKKKEHIRNGQLDTTQSALKAKSNATAKYQTNEIECKACFKRGHNADECRTICSNCDKTGHDWRTCTSECKKICDYCNGFWHVAAVCRKKRKDELAGWKDGVLDHDDARSAVLNDFGDFEVNDGTSHDTSTGTSQTVCSNCDQLGHHWRMCKKGCLKVCGYCKGGKHSQDVCIKKKMADKKAAGRREADKAESVSGTENSDLHDGMSSVSTEEPIVFPTPPGGFGKWLRKESSANTSTTESVASAESNTAPDVDAKRTEEVPEKEVVDDDPMRATIRGFLEWRYRAGVHEPTMIRRIEECLRLAGVTSFDQQPLVDLMETIPGVAVFRGRQDDLFLFAPPSDGCNGI